MHFVLDREYLTELPNNTYLDKYKRLLLELPDENSAIIKEHLDNAHLEFYCKCGCHSFFVNPVSGAELRVLQKEWGLYKEIAYKTNYNKELNVMIFVDPEGILTEVTIFFETGNTRVIPDDLEVTGIEGIW